MEQQKNQKKKKKRTRKSRGRPSRDQGGRRTEETRQRRRSREWAAGRAVGTVGYARLHASVLHDRPNDVAAFLAVVLDKLTRGWVRRVVERCRCPACDGCRGAQRSCCGRAYLQLRKNAGAACHHARHADEFVEMRLPDLANLLQQRHVCDADMDLRSDLLIL